jgi:hypothetical protein
MKYKIRRLDRSVSDMVGSWYLLRDRRIAETGTVEEVPIVRRMTRREK